MKLKSAVSMVFLTLVIAACGGKDDGGGGDDGGPPPGDDGMNDGPGDDGMQDGNNDGGNGDGGPVPGSLALGSFGAVAETGCPSSNLGTSDDETCAIALAAPQLTENLDEASPGTLAIAVGAGLMDVSTICDTTSNYCENEVPEDRSAWTKSDELRCAVFNRRPVDFRCKISEIDSRLQTISAQASSTLRRCMTLGATVNNFDNSGEGNPISDIDFEHYLQCTSQLTIPLDEGGNGLGDLFLAFGKQGDDWYIRSYGTATAGNTIAKVDATDNMEIWSFAGGVGTVDKKEVVHVVTDKENGIVEFTQFIADAWSCGMRAVLNDTYLRLEAYELDPGQECDEAVEVDLEEYCFDISTEAMTLFDGDLSPCDNAGLAFTLDMVKAADYTKQNITDFRSVVPDGVYNLFIPDPLYQARNVFFAETGYPNIKKVLDRHLGKDGVGGAFARADVWACVEATEEKAFDLGAEPPFDALAGQEVPLKFNQLLSCASNEAFFGFKEDNFYGRVFKANTATTLRTAKDGSSYELWEMASDAENESQVAFGVAGEGERIELTIAGEKMDVACGGQLATDGEYIYLKGRFMAGTPDADTTSGGPCSDDFAEELCAAVGDSFVEQDSMTECLDRGLAELTLPALRPDGDNALDFSQLEGIYTKTFDLADVKDFAGSGEGSGGEGEGDDGETTGEEGEPAE